MTNLNIFLENTYEGYNIDDIAIHKKVVKMTEHIFKDNDVISKSCLEGRKYETVSFDIVFVDNEEIHRINKEYRQKDRPTDVITFAIFADSPEEEKYIFDDEVSLGEIIVSLDKIEEQSKENNVSFEDELYFLVSHGVLHLLGFDHMTDDEYKYMVDKQKEAKAVILWQNLNHQDLEKAFQMQFMV